MTQLSNLLTKNAHTAAAATLAQKILTGIMPYRRIASTDKQCAASSCPACLAPHLQKVTSAVARRNPITFVLPAFPGKSPNPAKVLGPLPDMAERRALLFLNKLCQEIQSAYEPGARVILCSDGRVFSDIVGMREEDVTSYQQSLDEMIYEMGPGSISTFNLDEISEGNNFSQIRHDLIGQYGISLDALKEKVRKGGQSSNDPEEAEAHRMYCGITRFLFEDGLYPGQTKSRTAIQKDSRARAYEVIRRSNAWSKLIAERFPDAVRLSIHPQTCGAMKLGIQLLGTDSWMTPWHGVAVDTGNNFVLMKRWEAEKLDAQIVLDDRGRASHYRLAQTT